ncbi:MAG: hypothetical protein ABWY35_06625 [Pseudorhodoplanes sp.]
MDTYRFGRKLKLPSTAAIKHELLMLMLEDELKAVPAGGTFVENESAAILGLRRLKSSRLSSA